LHLRQNSTHGAVGRTPERLNRRESASTNIGGPEALDEAVQIIGANAIQADASKLEDLDRVAGAIRRRRAR
jgi:hypothetical protein